MGDYVMLGSTAAELLNAARRVKDKGELLSKTMRAAVDRINALDQSSTFPPDRFTNEFLNSKDGYHAPVDSGTNNGQVAKNEAVKANGLQIGLGALAFGNRALEAMWAYTATDDDNAADIGASGA
jgi:hypothetical protein